MAKKYKGGIYADIFECASYKRLDPRHFYLAGSTRVLVVGEGIPNVFDITPGIPVVELSKGHYGSPRCIPQTMEGEHFQFCAGGAFIYTSDSRFTEVTGLHVAISLHDMHLTARTDLVVL